jgi:hypothetical protein
MSRTRNRSLVGRFSGYVDGGGGRFRGRSRNCARRDRLLNQFQIGGRRFHRFFENFFLVFGGQILM